MKIKVKLTRHLRTGLIIFCSLIIVVLLFMLIITIKEHKYIDKKVPVYSYNNSGKISYSVSLLPNDIYEEKKLGEGQIYLTDYIKAMDTSFIYNFNGDKDSVIKGNYQVTAVVNGKLGSENNMKSVWVKNYLLVPKTDFNFSGKAASFKLDVPIDIKAYNEIVKKIGTETDVSFNSDITIAYKVNIESITDKGTIKEETSPTLQIPLGNKYFEVKGSIKDQKSGSIQNNKKVLIPLAKSRLAILGFILLLTLAGISYLILFTEPIVKNNYIKNRMKRIFKSYGDRIVSLDTSQVFTGLKELNVINIQDLVRLSDELSKPILYGKMSKFYVLDNDIAYTYELKDMSHHLEVGEEINSGVKGVL